MALTSRYDEALAFASELHREQERKGSHIPYLTHLLSVSALVIEGGGDEEQAIAGLLHDALEDQGNKTSYDDLAERFGTRVADIVRACSDTEVVPKPPWRVRKEAYLAHLPDEPDEVLLVSLSDKLHNARSMALDLGTAGPAMWDRFSAGRDEQLWYLSSLLGVFEARLPGHPLTRELALTLERLAA